MNSWDELSIALVYYSGLFIALALGIAVVWFLKSRKPLSKIFGGSSFWSRSFNSTLITAGLLGALTVSFRDCDGEYTGLLGRPEATINLGISEVQAALLTLAAAASAWFLILIISRLLTHAINMKSFLVSMLVVMGIVIPPAFILWFAITF